MTKNWKDCFNPQEAPAAQPDSGAAAPACDRFPTTPRDWRTYAGRNSRSGRIVLRLIQAGPMCWNCARCQINYERSGRTISAQGRPRKTWTWDAEARAGHAAATDRKTATEMVSPREDPSTGTRCGLYFGPKVSVPDSESLTWGSHLRPGRQRRRGRRLDLLDRGTLLAADRGFLAFEVCS